MVNKVFYEEMIDFLDVVFVVDDNGRKIIWLDIIVLRL